MNKTLRLSILASLLAVLCSPTLAADKHETHWDYKGVGGPKHWGEMKEEYSACKLSKEQSPINIETSKVEKAKLPALEFGYQANPAEIINNGHTVQVNLSNGGTLKIAGDEYKFLQFHFHTPSEEKVNGKAYPMVAHLVHKNEAGKLAVVAVLFKMGKTENAALKPVFSALPAKEGEINKLDSINPADFLPKAQNYFAFMGSLTTPPCSDGVRWQVLQEPVEISFGQLKAFKKLYKMNARPVQALNGRTVQLSQ